jgi:hypothetical protein
MNHGGWTLDAPRLQVLLGTGTDSNVTSGSAAGGRMSAVRLAIANAASRTGANFTYLLAQAKSESGLNPSAKATTSSAGGLYQFIDSTWLGMMKMHGAEHGYGWAANAISAKPGGGWTVSDPGTRQAILALKNDPQAASLMAGEFANDTSAALSKSLGRTPTSTDLYFGAFLGPKGASKFLKAMDASPSASAASLFPREARVNHGIFYTRSGQSRSLAQVYALMGKKIGAPDTGGSTNLQMASAAASDVTNVDVPASTSASSATVLANRGDRVNILRPDPSQARLAYMMVSTPYLG